MRLSVCDGEYNGGPHTFSLFNAVMPARHHCPYRDPHGAGNAPKASGKIHLERVRIGVYSIASRCIPDCADFPL
jgi:hypothetical protein